ncbi:MAG TPA: hypothetical protein VHU92_17020 [Streptosporangiaceae bacterium]|nr:hypothetical protein [Streptosporangiaceae bacterium]
MAPQAAVYQERYQWSRRTMSVVAAGGLAVLVAVGVAMPPLPTLLLLTAGVVALLWGAATRRVAVRVDARGVTLGGSPLRYRGTTVTVPWPDITNVLLWQQLLPPGTLIPHLGLERRQAATASQGAASRRQAAAAGLGPEIPADVLAASRQVTGWRLDRHGLARAVARFAPDVWVLDYDTGQRVTEDGR